MVDNVEPAAKRLCASVKLCAGVEHLQPASVHLLVGSPPNSPTAVKTCAVPAAVSAKIEEPVITLKCEDKEITVYHVSAQPLTAQPASLSQHVDGERQVAAV